MESIRQYLKRTDKLYLLLCIFSSTMAVVALASWAAKQGSGFATGCSTRQIENAVPSVYNKDKLGLCCLCVQPGPVCIWKRKVVLSWKAFDNI